MLDDDPVNTTPLGVILRDLGITQAHFARLADQDRAVVCRWVSGAREPLRHNKATILRVLRDEGWVGTSDDIWPVDVEVAS